MASKEVKESKIKADHKSYIDFIHVVDSFWCWFTDF